MSATDLSKWLPIAVGAGALWWFLRKERYRQGAVAGLGATKVRPAKQRRWTKAGCRKAGGQWNAGTKDCTLALAGKVAQRDPGDPYGGAENPFDESLIDPNKVTVVQGQKMKITPKADVVVTALPQSPITADALKVAMAIEGALADIAAFVQSDIFKNPASIQPGQKRSDLEGVQRTAYYAAMSGFDELCDKLQRLKVLQTKVKSIEENPVVKMLMADFPNDKMTAYKAALLESGTVAFQGITDSTPIAARDNIDRVARFTQLVQGMVTLTLNYKSQKQAEVQGWFDAVKNNAWAVYSAAKAKVITYFVRVNAVCIVQYGSKQITEEVVSLVNLLPSAGASVVDVLESVADGTAVKEWNDAQKVVGKAIKNAAQSVVGVILSDDQQAQLSVAAQQVQMLSAAYVMYSAWLQTKGLVQAASSPDLVRQMLDSTTGAVVKELDREYGPFLRLTQQRASIVKQNVAALQRTSKSVYDKVVLAVMRRKVQSAVQSAAGKTAKFMATPISSTWDWLTSGSEATGVEGPIGATGQTMDSGAIVQIGQLRQDFDALDQKCMSLRYTANQLVPIHDQMQNIANQIQALGGTVPFVRACIPKFAGSGAVGSDGASSVGGESGNAGTDSWTPVGGGTPSSGPGGTEFVGPPQPQSLEGYEKGQKMRGLSAVVDDRYLYRLALAGPCPRGYRAITGGAHRGDCTVNAVCPWGTLRSASGRCVQNEAMAGAVKAGFSSSYTQKLTSNAETRGLARKKVQIRGLGEEFERCSRRGSVGLIGLLPLLPQ